MQKIYIKKNMSDLYKNIEEYNSSGQCKILIVFDDMITDMLSNKKLNPTELFIRERKLNISFVFVTQLYFTVPKKYQTNFNTLFYYEKSKQKRTSTSCIQSSIRYWL